MEHTLDKYEDLVKYLFSLNRIQLISITELPKSWEKRVLDVCAGLFRGFSGMVCLSFRDRFDILLEKRPGGVAGLRYTILYGKSQVKLIFRVSRSDSLKKGEWIESDRVESKSS